MHAPETVPLNPADVAAYERLRERTVWFAGDDTGHLNLHVRVSGAKAGDVITGLVTNDVHALPVLGGQYAAALTPKSRVVADLRILRLEPESFLVSADGGCFDGWMGIMKKFVNPRLAAYAVDDRVSFGVYGADVEGYLERLAPGVRLPEGAYAATHAIVAGASVVLVRSPALGEELPGVELLVAPANAAVIVAALEGDCGPRGSLAVWEVARIEALRPRCGADMDETTLPQEANLDSLGAISFSKGCYTGQETVARIHFRGHVNRHLCLLQAEGAVPRGAVITDATGAEVGEVRSVGISPRMGVVALGMVRREVAAGTELRADGVAVRLLR